MSEEWRQSEICIVINNKSQGSIAKHLKCDELLYYTFFIQSFGFRLSISYLAYARRLGPVAT